MAQRIPASVRHLQAAIRARRDTLTPTERRLAAAFLEDPQEVVLSSVQELAARLHAGPASIVRVAKKLGYRGLSDLKRDLKRELRRDLSPLERFRRTLDEGGTAGVREIAIIARQEMRNLEATVASLDEGAFRQAAETLRRARAVYVVGIGASAHLAGLAAFVLQHIGVRCFAPPHSGLKIAEQLVQAGPGDALLAFSFPPYSPQTAEAASVVKRLGAAVVGITNKADAPVARFSDAVLVARTETSAPSNAVSAPMVIVHGLATAIAARSRLRSLKLMKATLSLREGP